MKAIIRTESLGKYFGEMAAVHEVNLTLQEGLFTSVIGPNGAGKTTLINLCPVICSRTGVRFISGKKRLPGWGRIKG